MKYAKENALKKIEEIPEGLVPSGVVPEIVATKIFPSSIFFGIKLTVFQTVFYSHTLSFILRPFNLFVPVIVYDIPVLILN
jgi:hypothetical protein